MYRGCRKPPSIAVAAGSCCLCHRSLPRKQLRTGKRLSLACAVPTLVCSGGADDDDIYASFLPDKLRANLREANFGLPADGSIGALSGGGMASTLGGGTSADASLTPHGGRLAEQQPASLQPPMVVGGGAHEPRETDSGSSLFSPVLIASPD